MATQIGGLDGSIMDADGIIWNARWGARCIDAYTIHGEKLRTIEVPPLQASCPASAGKNADRLVVTSAWESLETEVRSDLDGATFLLDLPFRGQHEPCFEHKLDR